MEALQSNLSKLSRRDIVSFELYCITEILHADSLLNLSHYLFMRLAKMLLQNLPLNLWEKIDIYLAFSVARLPLFPTPNKGTHIRIFEILRDFLSVRDPHKDKKKNSWALNSFDGSVCGVLR